MLNAAMIGLGWWGKELVRSARTSQLMRFTRGVTLEPDTVVFYKVDQVYSAAHDGGINWADPGLGIQWPVAAGAATLSDKDRTLPMLADLTSIFE